MRNIRLHIDRLVIEGVSLGPGDGARLRKAVERELTRLLAHNGLNPALGAGSATPRVAAPGIQLDAGKRPAEWGRQIAGTVYGGIGK